MQTALSWYVKSLITAITGTCTLQVYKLYKLSTIISQHWCNSSGLISAVAVSVILQLWMIILHFTKNLHLQFDWPRFAIKIQTQKSKQTNKKQKIQAETFFKNWRLLDMLYTKMASSIKIPLLHGKQRWTFDAVRFHRTFDPNPRERIHTHTHVLCTNG